MDLRLKPEEENFRDELVTFIDDAFPPEARNKPSGAEIEHWHQAVVNKGWSAPEWPACVGGTGWSQAKTFLWYTAIADFNCPQADYCGLQVVAPLLLEFGNKDQQRYLDNILNRSESWGNAIFLDASSNLLAEDIGDDYRVHGRVTCFFTSGYDRLLLSADTGDGHSLFLVDPSMDGITMAPVEAVPGYQKVNLDAACISKDCLLGEVNMALKHLEFLIVERQSLSPFVHLESGFSQLKEIVKKFRLQSEMQSQIAGIEIELAALKITGLRYALSTHHQEMQIVIVKGLALAQRIGDCLVDALGYYAIPSEQPLPGDNEPPLVFSRPRWKSTVMDTMPGCPEGFRRDLIARTLLGL